METQLKWHHVRFMIINVSRLKKKNTRKKLKMKVSAVVELLKLERLHWAQNKL